MVFIQGLPRSDSKDTFLAVVERLTKYAHFIPLTHPFTAKDVAETFLLEIDHLHGFPASIVSERDNVFLNNFWTELFYLAGTKLKFSSAYHPQLDGQTGEQVSRTCL